MSKYEFITQILGQFPSVVSTYFGMITSGNQSSLIAGILGLLGISYIILRILKRFWFRLILDRLF